MLGASFFVVVSFADEAVEEGERVSGYWVVKTRYYSICDFKIFYFP